MSSVRAEGAVLSRMHLSLPSTGKLAAKPMKRAYVVTGNSVHLLVKIWIALRMGGSLDSDNDYFRL
jgi:hypothetical protein